jgi:SAM-dependent methyltransferase
MKMPDINIVCPLHRVAMHVKTDLDGAGEDCMVCPEGCLFPRRRGIYRFVNTKNYASSFGIQWNTYPLTQLDSYTGVPLSEERLRRCLGGSFDVVRGKLVLEAGCGAGCFTEILLREGAKLVAVDLSVAVEANHRLFRDRSNYFVCQADILNLPFAPSEFDVVVCLGVLQHTPSPEHTIEMLSSQLRPGGLLVIDHYPHGSHSNPAQLFLRPIMINLPPKLSLLLCKALVTVLWPLHRFAFYYRTKFGKRRYAGIRFVDAILNCISPVADYHWIVQLSPKLRREWAMLGTHDALTDYYKHGRNVEEIAAALESFKLKVISVGTGGNGVEARAVKPFAPL